MVAALRSLLKVKSNPNSLWNRLTRKKRHKRRVPINLERKVDMASDFYQDFHWGNQPKNLIERKISKSPKVGVKLGQLINVTYKTSKGNEGPTYYEHEFGEEGGERPDLIADVDNKRLHIIGGDYNITEAGIID